MQFSNKKFLSTQKEVSHWLNEHSVKRYVLIKDFDHGFIVNVHGPVDLSLQKLTHIPVKFNEISGYFCCNDNQLTDLSFAPVKVEDMFNCCNNLLTTLIGSPHTVKGDFLCWSNRLISLEGAPNCVGFDFYCNDNHLTNLQFGPKSVGCHFCCNENRIDTLYFLPDSVGGQFNCAGNPLPKHHIDLLNLNKLKNVLHIEEEKKLITQFSCHPLDSCSVTKTTHKI